MWSIPFDQKEKTNAENQEVKTSKADSALVKSDESSNPKSPTKKEEIAIALGLATSQSKDSSEKKIDTTVSIPISTLAAEKIIEFNTDHGKELIFLSREGGSADTVKVFILFEANLDTTSLVKKVDSPVRNEIEDVKPKVDAAVVVTENEKEKPKEIKNPDTVKQATVTTVAPPEEIKKPEKKVEMINSDCRGLAIDADVDKLRIKMLAENNVDDRIAAARKYFKTKCFYTKQIKSLSELFLSDEGRYRFFDAAFPFAVDSDNFKQLVSLLSDEYFVNRFKAMVRL